MMTFIMIMHAIICVLLLIVILIQQGRGGGFIETLSGMESIFGTKTSSFLTRTTAILSVLFFITCLSLAVMSANQGKSLMGHVRTNKTAPVATESPAKEQLASGQKDTNAVSKEQNKEPQNSLESKTSAQAAAKTE